MEDALSLIDQIIDEHKYKMLGMQASEDAVNDIIALFEMYKSVEGATPTTSSDYRRNLYELQSSLNRAQELLENHFEREEKVLKIASELRPESAISSVVSRLVGEHDKMKRHIQRVKQSIAELMSVGLSDNQVKGKSYMVRAYLRNTMKLIESHIRGEEKLLHSLRNELIVA